MAFYTIVASPKKIVYGKPEDRLPWTGENAIYEENLLYDYSRQVDDLIKETKLDELRQKPRRLYRYIYFLAQPRPRGERWQKVAFFGYLAFAIAMWIAAGIWEGLTCLNPDSRLLFALIPFFVWLEVCLWSTAIAMREKPQSETPEIGRFRVFQRVLKGIPEIDRLSYFSPRNTILPPTRDRSFNPTRRIGSFSAGRLSIWGLEAIHREQMLGDFPHVYLSEIQS